jgi:N-acetylneuraminic acid mutarotase
VNTPARVLAGAAPFLGVAALIALLPGCFGATTQSAAPIDQRAPGHWEVAAALPAPRQEVAVAAVGDRVWVIGGLDESAGPVATVETFSVADNLWETRPPLPVAVHHAAAAVVDDRLFVLGGYSGGLVRWTPLDSVYEFDAARQTWETRAPMPTPRGGLAVAVLDGRIHALGGSARAATNAHEVYDPATNRWTPAKAMPTARDHLAAVAFQGRVWALGGRTRFLGEQFANVEVYDPATDSWRAGTPLPTGRGGMAAAALRDRILIFGGEAPFRIFDATEMYEVAGNRWIAKEPMRTPRHGIGAAIIGGRVYIPGGGTEPGFNPTVINDVYVP